MAIEGAPGSKGPEDSKSTDSSESILPAPEVEERGALEAIKDLFERLRGNEDEDSKESSDDDDETAPTEPVSRWRRSLQKVFGRTVEVTPPSETPETNLEMPAGFLAVESETITPTPDITAGETIEPTTIEAETTDSELPPVELTESDAAPDREAELEEQEAESNEADTDDIEDEEVEEDDDEDTTTASPTTAPPLTTTTTSPKLRPTPPVTPATPPIPPTPPTPPASPLPSPPRPVAGPGGPGPGGPGGANPNVMPTPQQNAANIDMDRYATKREAVGGALLAFGAAEVLSRHRDRKIRRNTAEQFKEVKKEAKESQEKLEEQQETAKRLARQQQEQISHLQQAEQQIQRPEARPERIVSRPSLERRPEQTARPERQAPTPEVRQPQQRTEVRLPQPERVTNPELGSRLVLEQSTAAAERGVAMENFYERRHEAKDDQTTGPLSNLPANYTNPATPPGVKNASRAIPSPMSMPSPAPQPTQATKQSDSYKKAAISGAIVGLVVLGIIIVIGLLA